MKRITSIETQVKNAKRCSIFLDGEFFCGLTLEAVVLNRLKEGMMVEEQTLVNIQLDSEKQTALDKAMTYLTASVKTEKQVCDYLLGKGYTQAVIDYVIEKLNGYGFLSDEDYARRYVETYSKSKGVRLIKTELKRKGVSDEDMQNAVEEIQGQSETAIAIAEKYMRGKVADIKTVQKLYRHLLSKGFTYDDAKCAVEKIKLNEDEIEQ